MTKLGIHGIERKSSIESEPRTLFFDEIRFAREGAHYIVNATTTEEATAIFTKGLEPAITTNIKEWHYVNSTDDEEWHYVRAHLRIRPQLHHEDMRDVVTAPF